MIIIMIIIVIILITLRQKTVVSNLKKLVCWVWCCTRLSS